MHYGIYRYGYTTQRGLNLSQSVLDFDADVVVVDDDDDDFFVFDKRARKENGGGWSLCFFSCLLDVSCRLSTLRRLLLSSSLYSSNRTPNIVLLLLQKFGHTQPFDYSLLTVTVCVCVCVDMLGDCRVLCLFFLV